MVVYKISIKESKNITPSSCREFASDMNIQNMASCYVKLYKQKLLNNDAEEVMFADSHELPEVSAQPQLWLPPL